MKNKKLKLGLKIATAAIGLPVASSIVLVQIDNDYVFKSNWVHNNRFFRDIVENNSAFVNVPLIKISMLGSHDSLSDDINIYSKLDTNQYDSQFDRKTYNLAKGLIVRYSKAQLDNVYDQLSAGIRFVDLRITHINGVYYTSHGLISNTLEHNLKLILKWLDENPGEFIMFNIVRFYHDKTKSIADEWEDLKSYLESVKYNDKNIFDYDYTLNRKVAYKDLTYNEICPVDEMTGERKAGAVISYTPDEYHYCLLPSIDIWCLNHNPVEILDPNHSRPSYISSCPEKTYSTRRA